MADKKEMTAQAASVGADAGQSLTIKNATIIPETSEKFNGEYDFPGTFPNITDPYFLPAISMGTLYETAYEGKPPIVDGILYPGTYLFAGAPKLGKSFLMLQLGYHVSTGQPLWGYSVRQGTVLYLALEDDFPRLQSRLYRMFDAEVAKNFYLSTWAKQTGSGLEEQVEGFVATHVDTRLVIIDTLQRVRPADGNRYSYASDYEIITSLSTLASKLGICLLIVHHTRKQQDEDKFNMISGTNGLLGAADGAFLLEKDKRTDRHAVLEIAGRDQQEQRLHLEHDPETLLWKLDHAETQLWVKPPEPVLQMVADFITPENPSWCGSPTDLALVLGIDMKPNQLSTKLNVNAQRLLNDYNIRYANGRSHAGRRISLQLISSEA
jgi:hypothetical protein